MGHYNDRTMLTLKKTMLELGEEEDHLFRHLCLDTEAAASASFLGGESGIKKSWFGEVKVSSKIFELVRTRVGIFRMNISAVVIKGSKKIGGKKGEFEVRYMLTWRTIINLSLMTFFFVSIAMYSAFDFSVSIIVILLWIGQILFLITDLNKTEEKFNTYLNQKVGNAP